MRHAIHTILTGLTLLVALHVSAEPFITEITHDSATGVTLIRWSGISDEEGIIVYRSTTPLDKSSLPFAKTYWFPPGSTEGKLNIKGTGTGHYRICASTPNRVPKGELSEERQLAETDRHLTPVQASLIFQEGRARLSTTALGNTPPPFRALLGRQGTSSPAQLLMELPWRAEPMAVPANFKTGFVTAVGSDGHGSLGRPLEWLYWGSQPNLHINGIPSPAKNQDIRLSRLHPVVGQPLHAEFRVSNRGFQSAASRIRLTVKATDDSAPIVKEIETEPIVPGKENWAPFELVPISCGKNLVTVEVICPDDGDQSDNRLAFPLYVTRKPLFFLWYGFAEDLEVANLAAPSAADKEDWRRRGALSLPIVSRKDTSQGDAYLSAMKGNDGFQYDELGGTWNAEQFLPALRDVRKRNPAGFQALWHIGASVKEPLKQALLDGTLDLLMVELYYTDGDAQSRKRSLEKLEKQLKSLIKQGVAEKTIVGLASKGTYKGWNTPESHAEFLAEQLRLIRRTAPMMPGVAFFSATTDPLVRHRMDDLCRELFLEEKP